MEIKVSIYERVKQQGKWREVPVRVPRIIKKDGSLFVKDNRTGRFIISWCENRKKKRQTVRDSRGGNVTYLEAAVRLASSKKWYLDNRQAHPVSDPTMAAPRITISEQISLYLDAKSGCKRTLRAHSFALREFGEFAAERHIAHVDEITKAHMNRFFERLSEGGNSPLTAASKILKVNAFYRAVMKLDVGKGVIRKRDYKRELAGSHVPQIYAKRKLDALFGAMSAEEHLAFSVFLEAGLRKKELMHLEDTDLIQDEIAPGKWKNELRIEGKPGWGYQTKTGADRNVLVSKELMDRLQVRKAALRPSKLLFGTSTGNPDHHLLDRLKAISKRAGFDPATCQLKKFRATAATNWLRSKELGGKGWDIGFVRQQLGHTDYKSIEAYIAIVRNEEFAMREQQKDGAPRLGGPGGLIYSVE